MLFATNITLVNSFNLFNLIPELLREHVFLGGQNFPKTTEKNHNVIWLSCLRDDVIIKSENRFLMTVTFD